MSDPTHPAPLKFTEAETLFPSEPRLKPLQMEGSGGLKPRILLGNDDPLENLQLFPSLVRAGYEVIVTETGTDALDQLRKTDYPAVAILRRSLPGTDALEICARMKEIGRDVYLILRCDDAAPAAVAVCLKGGADLVLPVTTPPESLLAYVGSGLRIIGRLRMLSRKLEMALRGVPFEAGTSRISDPILGEG